MLSIIIPALNEAPRIEALLVQLNGQTGIALQIIVADGGSSDDTAVSARRMGAEVTESTAGRGHQMNTGAALATGDYLLFLHADSQLTQPNQLADAVSYLDTFSERVAGHFRVNFETSDPDIKSALRFFEEKTALNRPGTFNGDQGLLLRRADFTLMQGFATDYPFLEDQQFGDRFRESGRFVTLPSTLITSARRFEQEGVQERIVLNTLIMGMYLLRLDCFFDAAPGVYRANSHADHLRLAPFFELVRRCVFSEGIVVGLHRCYQIGRYANQNFWQLFLWYGLEQRQPALWLARYDRLVAPLTNNFLGHLLGTVASLAWFFTLSWRYRRRS